MVIQAARRVRSARIRQVPASRISAGGAPLIGCIVTDFMRGRRAHVTMNAIDTGGGAGAHLLFNWLVANCHPAGINATRRTVRGLLPRRAPRLGGGLGLFLAVWPRFVLIVMVNRPTRPPGVTVPSDCGPEINGHWLPVDDEPVDDCIVRQTHDRAYRVSVRLRKLTLFARLDRDVHRRERSAQPRELGPVGSRFLLHSVREAILFVDRRDDAGCDGTGAHAKVSLGCGVLRVLVAPQPI